MRLLTRLGRSVVFHAHEAGSKVCISAIEIIGRKRMNRNIKAKKNPIVPRNMLQSHTVGAYMPHDDGK